MPGVDAQHTENGQIFLRVMGYKKVFTSRILFTQVLEIQVLLQGGNIPGRGSIFQRPEAIKLPGVSRTQGAVWRDW